MSLRNLAGPLVAVIALSPTTVFSQELPEADAGPTAEVATGPENTLDFCRDGLDNDGDSHVDCDDQDCGIFAICVKPDAPQGQEEAQPGPVEKGPANEQPGAAPKIIHRPFSIGFVPGLTTDGGADGLVINNFSLNFIGWGDYLKGADVSMIGGIRKRDVTGFQGAGIFNYTNGGFTGFQAAGIADIARGRFTGFQGSGIASVALSELTGFQGAGIAGFAGGNLRGFQGSGISSVTTGSFIGFQGAGIADATIGPLTGLQAAGIANATIGPLTGLQAAGITNYAYSVTGAQISGIINVAPGEVRGLQAGLINYGTSVRGAQIGLVNIAAKEMKGAPIGLVSFAGDGIFAPTIWGSDNSMLNLGLKMGSRHVFGILGYGIHPAGSESRDSVVTGLGGHIDLDPAWLEIDLTTHWLHADFDWINDDIDMIHKLRVSAGYRVLDELSLFAGPTLNLLVSEVRDDADLIPAFARYSDDNLTVKLSIGFIAGLQWEPKWGRLNSR